MENLPPRSETDNHQLLPAGQTHSSETYTEKPQNQCAPHEAVVHDF